MRRLAEKWIVPSILLVALLALALQSEALGVLALTIGIASAYLELV